jgi:hypothetical protein
MRYTVNGKNLAVGRLMPRGKDADSRLKHVHVSKDGVTAFHPQGVVRVSLPAGVAQPAIPVLVPQAEVDKWHLRAEETLDIPEDVTEPGVTSPDYLVPALKSIIPDPNLQYATFTVNAEILLKMLKVAVEVCEDSEKACRLRFYPNEGKLRIDTYRQPGQQEFVGVISELEYAGDYIPGDKSQNAPKVAAEKKPAPKGIALKTDTGRKFRA